MRNWYEGEETNPEESARNVQEMIATPGWKDYVRAIKAMRDELEIQQKTISLQQPAQLLGQEYIRLSAEINSIDRIVQLAEDMADDRE